MRGMRLSDGPQLFLDDYVVARMENVGRRLEQPVKHEANPLIVQDRPWEKRFVSVYGTVWFESEPKRYRCLYAASSSRLPVPDRPEGPGLAKYYLCYGESEDGIEWSKPNVGPGPFASYDEHNIVIPEGHGMSVMFTPDDPDPQKQYKGFGGRITTSSPDGVHWQYQPTQPEGAIGKNDTSSSVVYWNGQYMAYVRYQISDPVWPGVMRGVGLSVSHDFVEWTPKELIFATDEKDGYPWSQPYGMSVTPYGDVLIGVLWFIHLDRVENNNSVGDQDMQLMVSRDGRRWERVADRAVFMESTPGTWDCGRVHPSARMIVGDDEVRVYYSGCDTRHGEGWGASGIGLATLAADRFVALCREKPASEAAMETLPICADGDELVVNADIKGDRLQVELVDQQGSVLSGFGREQSRLVKRDSLRRRVSWADNGEEKSWRHAAGYGARSIRFILGDCRLYSFHITRS